MVKIFAIFFNFKFFKLQMLFYFELSYFRITSTLKIFKTTLKIEKWSLNQLKTGMLYIKCVLTFLIYKFWQVYEAKHHQKTRKTLVLHALSYSPLCSGSIWWVWVHTFAIANESKIRHSVAKEITFVCTISRHYKNYFFYVEYQDLEEDNEF